MGLHWGSFWEALGGIGVTFGATGTAMGIVLTGMHKDMCVESDVFEYETYNLTKTKNNGKCPKPSVSVGVRENVENR